MKKLKSVGITGRLRNKLAVKAAKKAVKLLETLNVDFVVDERFPVAKPVEHFSKFNVDAILTFGGDGTFLRTFRALKKEIPVAGINCGRRGYLMDFNSQDIEHDLPGMVKGNYSLEKRTRLQAVMDGKRLPLALNEITVVPEMGGRLIKYKLKIDGFSREEGSDGLIVATPTGSTGHSLSAGGPIITGKSRVLVVTSINPIDWTNRPMVIDDNTAVKVLRVGKEEFEVIIDGQERHEMKQEVEIRKAKSVTFLRKK